MAYVTMTVLAEVCKHHEKGQMMDEMHSCSGAEHDARTMAERRAAGKELRSKVPRSSHAEWTPATDRPNPLSLLEDQNRTRLPNLVPLRFARMSASPFTFLRGSAIVMAQDLAGTPVTGIQVQICGDAHLNNFGIYATPERNQVFDVNDFDETMPGPWEWDLKRFVASIMLAGRNNGFPSVTNRQAVLSAIQSYREHMWKYSEMRHIDVWYSRIDYESSIQFVRRTFRWYIEKQREKSRQRSHLQALPKLTVQVDGQHRIKDDPPLIMHLEDEELTQQLKDLVETYRPTVQEDRRVLLSKYRCVDLAQKVVGVGSVGTRCYVVLMMGNDSYDPLLLQIKEAQASVLERHLGPSVYPNHAQRVVNGQRLMQAASDLFLGWTRLEGNPHEESQRASLEGIIESRLASSPTVHSASYAVEDYYIRQLRDMKLTVDLTTLIPEGFIEYCRFCGWALARAHARSGDSAKISGYLGRSDTFDRALAAFAETYANQAERDHAEFVAVLQSNQAVQSLLG
jgi:uncharacterized protein (DUF2252 family)